MMTIIENSVGNRRRRRCRFGSCLFLLSLAILCSQLVIHPIIFHLSPPADNVHLHTNNQNNPFTSTSSWFHRTLLQPKPPPLQQQQHLSSTHHERQPDGYFNNVPIYFNDGATASHYSKVHCVGETHHIETAWMYRSCHYRHFCFDTNSSEFVILRNAPLPVQNNHNNNSTSSSSSTQSSLLQSTFLDDVSSQRHHHGMYRSTTPFVSSVASLLSPSFLDVALGGINPRWTATKGRDKGIHKVRWSPRIVSISPQDTTTTSSLSYYEFPQHIVLVPFHSFAAHNIGHLLWDDFLPIYNLLSMFDLIDGKNELTTMTTTTNTTTAAKTSRHLSGMGKSPRRHRRRQHLLIRSVLKRRDVLYGTCEKQPKKERQCQTNFEQFLPAMGIDPKTFSTNRQYRLSWTTTTTTTQPQGQSQPPPHPRSNLICAKHGVAGIGMLTDHGWADHGWVTSSSVSSNVTASMTTTMTSVMESESLHDWSIKHPHNVGRGPLLVKFRDYLLDNLGFPSTTPQSSSLYQDDDHDHFHNHHHNNHVVDRNDELLQIIFSTNSSRNVGRQLMFEQQIEAVRRAFVSTTNDNYEDYPKNSHSRQQQQRNVVIHTLTMSQLSLREQVQYAHTARVFVTACGGGAVTATFLPRGATLIIYYPEQGGYDFLHHDDGPTTTTSSSTTKATSSKMMPAYLDWDLFNNMAHLNVHWFPIGTMNTQDSIDALIQLLREELLL